MCGYHPAVVVMDLHKKGALNMPVSDIPAPPPEYDGRVNMKDFWASVTAKIVCQGLLDSEATASNGTPAATASDGTPASVARLMCAEREIKDFRLWECPKTLLPESVLEDIFIDVVLQEGDEAILTLALVCTRFRDLVTREAFRRRAHFLWLDSVTNWSAFSTYYKAEYYKMYRLQTCMQCGDIFKNCIPGYVGRGRRGELIKIISEDTHPDFCSEFCQICADFI